MTQASPLFKTWFTQNSILHMYHSQNWAIKCSITKVFHLSIKLKKKKKKIKLMLMLLLKAAVDATWWTWSSHFIGLHLQNKDSMGMPRTCVWANAHRLSHISEFYIDYLQDSNRKYCTHIHTNNTYYLMNLYIEKQSLNEYRRWSSC